MLWNKKVLTTMLDILHILTSKTKEMVCIFSYTSKRNHEINQSMIMELSRDYRSAYQNCK